MINPMCKFSFFLERKKKNKERKKIKWLIRILIRGECCVVVLSSGVCVFLVCD